MQHIPVVSHTLWRGTFILKMLDVVPTLQRTGSYRGQDLCLFTVGRGGSQDQGVEGRGERYIGGGFPVSCSVEADVPKRLSGGVSRAGLGRPLPGSVHWRRFFESGRVNTAVPLYIQWVEPRLFPTLLADVTVPPPPVYPSPPPPPPLPLTQPASCLFFSCTCIWPGA